MFARPRRPAERAPGGTTGGPRLETSALFLLATLAVVWGWWAWKEGAYFGVVMLPGGLVLCGAAVVLAIRAPWRGDLRLSTPAALALTALIALAGWTALSALWSPAPDIALVDGQRVLLYALAFGLGIWLCNLLGPRMELSPLPVVAAAAFAGIATIIALLGPDPGDLLEIDGTLDYPLGYRNANVAFFAIAFFPAVGLASSRQLDWRARGGALAVATLCADVFLAGQSRASLPAVVIAIVVFTMLSPERLRAASWMGLAVLPALAILPATNALYDTANSEGLVAASSEMHALARTFAFTTAIGLVLGLAATRYERYVPGLRSRGPTNNRMVARALAGLGAAAVLIFVIAVGNPISWIGDRATEFRETGTPDLTDAGTRFSLNAGSNRADMWRVALRDFADDPLFGDGAGGFQYSYTLHRDSPDDLHDAHSVELEHLAELGVVGLGLFLLAAGGAAFGAIRARRLGPTAAGLSAVCLASGAYWFVHASIDWFWPYAAVTAPVLMLLGAACAPAVLALKDRSPQRWRRWLIMAAIALAVVMMPPFLSERYTNDAFSSWRDDLERAYDDLDASRTLNPLADLPILAEGFIARATGDLPRATAAFREAVEKRPEEWAGHYMLAVVLADEDPLLARNEVRVALELNPRSPRVQALADELGVR